MGAATAHYVVLVPDLQHGTCTLMPVKRWYNFAPRRQQPVDLTAEELNAQVRLRACACVPCPPPRMAGPATTQSPAA